MTRVVPVLAVVLVLSVQPSPAQEKPQSQLTYKNDIAPILSKYCLPCHLAENENPSGLSLDNYETLMEGGNHGKSVLPGKPDESYLYLKLLPHPPFGKQMARNKKRLTQEEMKIVYDWIKQGAKKE